MRRALLLSALALQACAPVVWKGPDRCLSCTAGDNPFTLDPERGWKMRRYEWHAFYAGASTGASYALQRAGMNETAAAITSSIAIGIAPHLLQRRTSIDAADWIADAAIRAAPLAVKFRWRGLAAYATVYAFVASYASP